MGYTLSVDSVAFRRVKARTIASKAPAFDSERCHGRFSRGGGVQCISPLSFIVLPATISAQKSPCRLGRRQGLRCLPVGYRVKSSIPINCRSALVWVWFHFTAERTGVVSFSVRGRGRSVWGGVAR